MRINGWVDPDVCTARSGENRLVVFVLVCVQLETNSVVWQRLTGGGGVETLPFGGHVRTDLVVFEKTRQTEEEVGRQHRQVWSSPSPRGQ